jgi:hypothetical protein
MDEKRLSGSGCDVPVSATALAWASPIVKAGAAPPTSRTNQANIVSPIMNLVFIAAQGGRVFSTKQILSQICQSL